MSFSALIGRTTLKVLSIFNWLKAGKNVEKVFRGLKRLGRRLKKKSRGKKTLKTSKARVYVKNITFFALGVLFSTIFLFIPFQVYSWYRELPNPELLNQRVNMPTRILDKEGRLLYEIFVEKKFNPIPIDNVPDYMINATLAIEDHEFYSHKGIRPLSMIRALGRTLIEGEVQGGSTLTQQLVKNVLLSPEQTIARKIKEAVLAVLAEHIYSKKEILELYLNNTPYGGNAWGIQSASWKYFEKNASDLDLAESAMLAGLPSAPSTYSPILGSYELSKFRQKQVLDRMLELGYITKEEVENAYRKELVFAPQISYIRAPHFVNYVQNELIKLYGRRFVELGGLEVVTSLDLDIQEYVQDIVRKQVSRNRDLKISNGAAVVLDVKSGKILAYVGSADYFSSEIDGKFDVVTAYRQPGSSIKPVTYSLAFGSGYTAASVIYDSPVTYQINEQLYSPKNYDGKFHGKVTLRQALANSYNVPAVKLVRSLGPDNMVELGRKMGLLNWKMDNTYGLSVTLGGKEVRLIDLTNVYALLARGGVYKNASPFISIKDSNGFELYKSDADEGRQVIDEGVAYLITNILSDDKARIPAFGTGNWLTVSGHTVAVKTGTTDEKRDNWTFGYTPSYAVGVWVGNNDNSPMHQYLSSGLSGASPIWNEIMTFMLQDQENEKFKKPDNIVVKTDPECSFMTEVFLKGTAPDNLCNVSEVREKKDGKNR